MFVKKQTNTISTKIVFSVQISAQKALQNALKIFNTYTKLKQSLRRKC